MVQALVFFFVSSDFLHQCVLPVDKLEPFFEAGVIVVVYFLLEHYLKETPKGLCFSFIVRACTDFADGLNCSEFGNIVKLVLRFPVDFIVHKL